MNPPSNIEKAVEAEINELFHKCNKEDGFYGLVLQAGIDDIQKKYHVLIYLSRFLPVGASCGEALTAEITIQVEDSHGEQSSSNKAPEGQAKEV